MVRGIRHLSSTWRKRLVDGLCSNLSVLSVSSTTLNALEGGNEQETALAYRNALKAYTFLLHLILCQVGKDCFGLDTCNSRTR
jgi:non-SMC mitotic condensation complex subunit 1, N-term